MKFGMLHLFENPIDKTEHQIVKEQLGLMRAAEDVGFDSIWPAEHHFTEYGYCASPAVTLAAIASVTTRIASNGRSGPADSSSAPSSARVSCLRMRVGSGPRLCSLLAEILAPRTAPFLADSDFLIRVHDLASVGP